jgi:hypothetical protein
MSKFASKAAGLWACTKWAGTTAAETCHVAPLLGSHIAPQVPGIWMPQPKGLLGRCVKSRPACGLFEPGQNNPSPLLSNNFARCPSRPTEYAELPNEFV